MPGYPIGGGRPKGILIVQSCLFLTMVVRILSVSDLCGYLYCKRKLYIEKVLGIREPARPQLALGSVRHRLYESVSKGEQQLVSSVQRAEQDHIAAIYRSAYSSALRNALISMRSRLQQFAIDLSAAFRDIWPKVSVDAEKRAAVVFAVAHERNVAGPALWDALYPKIDSEQWISSDQLGIRGIVDRIERWPDRLLPVELKTGSMPQDGVWPSHRVQIACYMLLVSEREGAVIDRGIVEYLDHGARREVVYNPFMREEVVRLRDNVRALFASAQIPEPCGKASCLFCRRSELPSDPQELREYFRVLFADTAKRLAGARHTA